MDDEAIILHSVDFGWEIRFQAPKDVRDPTNREPQAPASIAVMPAYAALGRAWRADLAAAADGAVDWWTAVVTKQRQGEEPWRDAAIKAYRLFLSGPGGHEALISVVRRYWLAAVDLSRDLPPDQRMLPEDFLLSGLDRTRDRRSVLILTAMPYWPIGIDAQGRWC